jgi:Ran GTPase-activating protein (RanGAP) involved in mRNA processing and transport
VTTFAFRSRGKNTISSLDSLISYLSQLDRKAPIIKKQQIDEEDEEDEDLEEEEEEEE